METQLKVRSNTGNFKTFVVRVVMRVGLSYRSSLGLTDCVLTSDILYLIYHSSFSVKKKCFSNAFATEIPFSICIWKGADNV